MNAKRILCLLLSVMMCLSMMGTLSLSVATAATANDALTDNMIFVNLSWTPANLPAEYRVDGRTYDLVWGRNAYADAQTAVDAAPEGGTVYLCAGGYVEDIYIKKSLTLLGAKHGIDPNIRGAKESDPWTLNPERGFGETVIECGIYLGMINTGVFDDYSHITVDGIKMSDDARLSANNGAAGYVDLKLRNIYVADIDRQTGVLFYMSSRYNPTINTMKRYITVENMRVEGFTAGNYVMSVTAEELDVSGVYMDENCTKPFIQNCSVSNGPTDEVYWNIHDNFFAAPVYRVVYLNWYNPTTPNGQDMKEGAKTRSKIVNNIYNNVFVEASLGFRMDAMENVHFNFSGNAFYNDNTIEDVKNNGVIVGWIADGTQSDYSDQIVVKNNKFIGNLEHTYAFTRTTQKVDVSGNYSFKNGTVTTALPAAKAWATESWYWKDEAMSVKSTDSGTGVTVTATQGLYNGKFVPVSDSLPDDAVLVNPSWTEETLPATADVRGKTFSLHWGVNAFADFQAATVRARQFGRVYLFPGTYAAGFVVEKDLNILGANFGINPNVRGQNEKELWTRNTARGDESSITGQLELVNPTTDTADCMVVDGVQLTGSGCLRVDTPRLQGYANIKLKNIYSIDSTGIPFYLKVYGIQNHDDYNAFRRDVTIENVRILHYTGGRAFLELTAERADISGVYMHTDCTQVFLLDASVSIGSTAEAIWTIHNNQFAANVARGIYLNWDSPSVYVADQGSNNIIDEGMLLHTKIINNVFNNAFVDFYNKDAQEYNHRSVAARLGVENIYFNFVGNSFYQEKEIAPNQGSLMVYDDQGKKLDFSDQVVVKNNRFLGRHVNDFVCEQSTKAIDISGNYAESNGTARKLTTSAATLNTQSYYYLDPLMTKKSTDTSVLKAPTNVYYEMSLPGTGRADGVVTVVLPTGHNAEDIYLFWADANGKLAGYSGLAPFKVAGTITANRIKNGSFVPAGATRLLAYSYSAECGLSEAFASLDLPEEAAMVTSSLGALKAEFQMVGDLHIASKTVDRIHHDEHMYAMLNDIKAVSPESIGIFANGDLADRGTDADYQKVLKILGSVEDAANFYPTFGNHETFRFDLPVPSGKTLADYQDVFYDFYGNLIPDTAVFAGGERFSTLTYAFTKNGYKFISLGTDVLDQNRMQLNDTTVTWVKNQLDADRDPTRPVFVIMHQTLSDTVADDDGVLSPTDADLKNLFKNYPEVFIFNGHTHTPLNSPISAYIGDESFPSSFNCSSVGYIPPEYLGNMESSKVGSEGFYVYVYENAVLVRGRDFINGEWVATAQYVINTADGAPDQENKVVESPVYGMTTTPTMIKTSGKISGTIQCWLPADHKANDLVLFFADKDGGILSTQPFATAAVSSTYAAQYYTANFANQAIPSGADYILVYSHSDTLGYSANCEVIRLDEITFATSGSVSAGSPEQFGLPVLTTGEAAIGNVEYATVADAFEVVKNGETIRLLKNVTVGQIIIPAGITLNLNGKTMKADYVLGLNDSQLIDSTAPAVVGKIIVAKKNMALSKDNEYLPVYDAAAGAYLFTRLLHSHAIDNTGVRPIYSTGPLVKEYVHPLLNTESVVAASGVDVIIRLTWTDSDGQYTGSQDYAYFDHSIARVIASYYTWNGTVKYDDAFFARFVGTEIASGVGVLVSTVVKSNTGVEMESEKLSLFTTV